jgi:hypothetical protein
MTAVLWSILKIVPFGSILNTPKTSRFIRPMIGFEDVMYYEINKHYVEVKLETETYKGGTNLLWPMSE